MIFDFLNNYQLFGSTLLQYAKMLLWILLALTVGRFIYSVVIRIVKNFTKKTKTQLDDIIIELIERPMLFLITLFGLIIGIEQLTLSTQTTQTLHNITLVLTVLNVAWVVINFIDAIIRNYLAPYAQKNASFDHNMIPAIGKIIKIFLWAIVLILLATNFGYDVSALLAGLGLGGLAFALAAQDLLSNLFGGLAIITDKPFKVGDRVKWNTNDGFVRQIGFRTTRIETLDGTQLVVPNSELAKTTLENISKEPARRVVAKIGLVYDTPTKKMKQAEDIIKEIVLKHKELKDDSVVGFSDFGDFALIITVVYWIKDPAKTLAVKSSVNMEIKDKFEKAGLEFAFPTQEIILRKVGKKK